MKLTGENRRARRKTCPSATLYTTNPTRAEPGSNPDLRGERPPTNRLSHGTAKLSSVRHDSSSVVLLLVVVVVIVICCSWW
jgi:hypothetical protein